MKKKNSYRNSEKIVDICINVCLVVVAFVAIYPLWYVLIASVSEPGAIGSGKVTIWPLGINLEGYEKLFATKKIWVGYRNSLIYTVAGTVLNLLVQLPCAYALSRKRLPFRHSINVMLIVTMYFSGGMVPSYVLMSKMGLIDNPLVMIIPCCLSVYNVILSKNYFEENIPESLYEAARIDGASYTYFFLRIVLPLSPSIIAIVALFSMQGHWNDYLNAKMYLYSANLQTLQQVIAQITANLDTTLVDTTAITAAELAKSVLEKQLMKYAVVVVASIPMILLYPIVQKFFIKGIMVGAVKG